MGAFLSRVRWGNVAVVLAIALAVAGLVGGGGAAELPRDDVVAVGTADPPVREPAPGSTVPAAPPAPTAPVRKRHAKRSHGRRPRVAHRHRARPAPTRPRPY